MSKLDAQRAMREARYNAQKRPAPPVAARPPVAPPAAPAAEDGLCGHRSISGRTCTRELGHAAASHRYA